MLLTRIRRGATSWARLRISIIIPPLDAGASSARHVRNRLGLGRNPEEGGRLSLLKANVRYV